MIFDLDGTLIDSLEDIHDALVEALREEGLGPVGLDETRGLIGHGSYHLVRGAVGPDGPVDRVRDRFFERYRRGLARKTRLYEGVPDVLDALRRQGTAVGVATNKPAPLARPLLETLGLSALLPGLAGGDEGPRKPDPALLELSLSRLGHPAERLERVVYVGDMPVDAEAARRLGVSFLAAGWGFTRAPFQAEVWLEHPRELRSWLLDGLKNEGG